MKKYLYLILILCAISLAGCGTKDVVYDTEETVGSNTSQEETKENSKGTPLAQTLGIEEDMWKEEIGAGTNTVSISAQIVIPEVTDMYTQEVMEHYYTPEEQKEIAEYFLDADTIRVNKNKVISKEWLQKSIESYYGSIESNEQYFKSIGAEDSGWSGDKKILSDEIQRLTDLMDEAPSIKDVSETAPDYSENYYIGSKRGVEYTLSFDMEPETNTSSWMLEAVNGNDFSSKQISEVATTWHQSGFDLSDNENICEMTREEACAKAKELCERFGISDMEVEAAPNLMFTLQPGQSGVDDYAPYYDGYYVVLVRKINGVALEDDIEYYDRKDGGNFNAASTEKTYDKERVIVELNDKGIVAMTYEGCVTAKEVGNEVKLLSYEQIQEIFRKELSKLEEQWVFRRLYLKYVRVIDEEKTDQYCYIPAWLLSSESLSDKATASINDGMIWLNAIDGSRIDPVKAEFACYNTVNSLQGFEFNWEDE